MKAYEKFISKDGVQKIHEMSLKILKEIGVKIEHEQALALFKKVGAELDGDIVRIDERLVEDSLKQIPSSFEIYTGTDKKITLGGGTKVRMPAMGNIYISSKGKIRKMNDDEIIAQFKLGDTSPFLNSSAFNYLTETESMTQDEKIFYYIAMPLKYANHPCIMLRPDIFHIEDGRTVKDVTVEGVQLVKRFFGKDGNVTLGDINPISPLTYDHDPIERLFGLCEEKQPIWICPCAMPMMTAPASVASMVAQTNAEILAGIVLIQLIQPGTPVLYGNTSASTNLRTIQLSIGAPETALVSYATAGLADLYQLPLRTGGGLSDAKELDAQAGLESMMIIQATQDCDPDLVMHSCGTIGSFNVVSFEKYLIDEEIWGFSQRLFKGVNTEEKNFCFKDLKKAGPRGTFVTGRTPKMYREEFVLPKYLNKEDPNQWQAEGGIGLEEALSKAVQERIESYQPPEITKEQDAILRPYLPEKYRERI